MAKKNAVLAILLLISLAAAAESEKAGPVDFARFITEHVLDVIRADILESSGIDRDTGEVLPGSVISLISKAIVFCPDLDTHIGRLHAKCLTLVNALAVCTLSMVGLSIILQSITRPDPAYKDKAAWAIIGIGLANCSLEITQVMLDSACFLTAVFVENTSIIGLPASMVGAPIIALVIFHISAIALFIVLSARALFILFLSIVSPVIIMMFCLEATYEVSRRIIGIFLIAVMMGPVEGLIFSLSGNALSHFMTDASVSSMLIAITSIIFAVIVPLVMVKVMIIYPTVTKTKKAFRRAESRELMPTSQTTMREWQVKRW